LTTHVLPVGAIAVDNDKIIVRRHGLENTVTSLNGGKESRSQECDRGDDVGEAHVVIVEVLLEWFGVGED